MPNLEVSLIILSGILWVYMGLAWELESNTF